MTIAAAAPPHSASVCGRYGTARGSATACACSAMRSTRSRVTEKGPRGKPRSPQYPPNRRASGRDDEEDDYQQGDDDQPHRERDRLPAGECVVDLLGLRGDLRELLALERGNRGGRLVER